MTQGAVGDGARRRVRIWPPREAADDVADPAVDPAAVPDRDALAGSQELTALLDEIDVLRLGLAADLGLAASALDAEVPEIARDVLAGAQDDLARFALRAELRLRDAADAEPPAVPVAPAALRPRRRLALLAPALTAAAALVGLLAGVVPSTGPALPERSIATSAAASYAELYRLHELGAPAPRLARAARQLHAEVARLVAVAGDDPATTRQALRLLELQVRVLADPQHGGALAAELAESQRLLGVLRSAALGTTVATLLAGLPAPPSPDDVRMPTSAAVPVPAPLRAQDDATTAATPAQRPTPAPAAVEPAQRPTPAPAAVEPAPAPAAAPADEPSPQASPEPSAEPSPTTSPAPDDPSTWFPTNGTGSILPR